MKITIMLEEKFNQEKNEIRNIAVASIHRIKRDSWLAKKRVLDVIRQEVEATKDIKVFHIPLTAFKHISPKDNDFRKLFLMLDNFKKDNILDYELIEDDRDSTRMVILDRRDYLQIVIPNLEKFKDYHANVTEIYNFIKEDGIKRFQEAYTPQISKSVEEISESFKKEWNRYINQPNLNNSVVFQKDYGEEAKVEKKNNKLDTKMIISSDIIKVKTKVGSLTFNKRTGYLKFGNFEAKNLNPQRKEAKVLLKLMTAKDNLVTYSDLLNNNITDPKKRELSFIIRNLKENLGILPLKKAKNKNCIKNIKKYGYQLIS